MKNSEMIFTRLLEEASAFNIPEKRQATLERLKSACDLLENGYRTPASNGSATHAKRLLLKINPTNIDKVVRANNWQGPTRSFIANRRNGLLGYVTAREEERIVHIDGNAKLPHQSESLLSEIPNVETRQAVRREVERRRLAEQELKIIKSGLRNLPQIDVRALLGDPVSAEKVHSATPSHVRKNQNEDLEQIRFLLERLRKDIRHIGLKRDGGDILAMNNAPVILETELRAIIAIAGLPLSLINTGG